MSGSAAAKAQEQKNVERMDSRSREQSPRSAMSGAYADVLALQQSAGNQAVHDIVKGGIPPIAQSVINSGGQPLEPGLRAQMESRFGQDFSQVRIHTDGRAANSAEEVSAKAYTVGRDVVFGQGRYAPDTRDGKRLLAHELAHVVQQSRGGPPPLSPDAPHEAAAESAASAVMSGSTVVTVSGATGVGLACDEDDKKKRKPRWSQGLKPNQLREQERMKEVLEEFKERAHDDNAKLDEERTSNRSNRSEQARHRDRSKDVDEHHGFPKFIGGNRIQTYIKLTKELHYLYHEELYLLLEKELKALGKLPNEAGRTSRRHYGRMVKSLSLKQQNELQAKILKHAKEFDDRYRSNEYPDKRQRLEVAVRRGIREAAKGSKVSGKSNPIGKGPVQSLAVEPSKPAAAPTAKVKPASKQEAVTVTPTAKGTAKAVALSSGKAPAKSLVTSATRVPTTAKPSAPIKAQTPTAPTPPAPLSSTPTAVSP